MKYGLTICYITGRKHAAIEWFADSLNNQSNGEMFDVLIIDRYAGKRKVPNKYGNLKIKITEPKPNVWQGKHRLTKEDWWAVSNARNTGICLCKTDWIALVDDRAVLVPKWLDAVRDAMDKGYAVCGSYEKRINMKVERGVIKNDGIVIGKDSRMDYCEKYWDKGDSSKIYDCPGSWWYGCTSALPLEWCLKVNGYDEVCDSLGFEDCMFGAMLKNNGFEMKYDRRMHIIEDRSVEFLTDTIKRADKGVSPNDKSHAILNMLKDRKVSTNPFDIRKMRDSIQAGNPFPIPTEPTKDWYDGQPLSEM